MDVLLFFSALGHNYELLWFNVHRDPQIANSEWRGTVKVGGGFRRRTLHVKKKKKRDWYFADPVIYSVQIHFKGGAARIIGRFPFAKRGLCVSY